jgi:hypothetical protein
VFLGKAAIRFAVTPDIGVITERSEYRRRTDYDCEASR